MNSNPFCVVFEEDDKLSGYLFAHKYGHLGYQRDKPYVLESLIKHVNNYAYENGIKKIEAKIPFDPEIMEILLRTGIVFHCIEAYPTRSVNMLQIVNLHSLFEHMIPELEDRLRTSLVGDWKGILEIGIEKDKVQLCINKGKIEIIRCQEPDWIFAVKEIYLLKLILGLLSFDEMPTEQSVKIDSIKDTLLRTLFPRKMVTSGGEIWG